MTDDDTSIDAQILDLMLRAGSRWVLWLLIGLSLVAVAVMFERLWFFVQEKKPARVLEHALEALRKKGPVEAARLLKGVRSMEAVVARGCLERADDGAAAVDEHRAAIVEQERQRYETRLAFLGTLGNNAPFIGLFGTVLGIIRAFHDLAGNLRAGHAGGDGGHRAGAGRDRRRPARRAARGRRVQRVHPARRELGRERRRVRARDPGRVLRAPAKVT